MTTQQFGFALFKYFPHGGLQRDFLKFTDRALVRGHRVRAYAPDWSALPDPWHERAGVEFVTLARTGHFNHTRDASFCRALQREQARRPVPVLLGFNKMPGLDAYYAADSCFLAKAYAQRPRCYRWLPRFKRYVALERAVFGVASKTQVLSISDRELALYQQYYQTPELRCHRLPPGIERDRVASLRTPAEQAQLGLVTRASLGLAAGERLLSFIGSGFRKKGLDRALQAFAALPPALRAKVRLLVAGADHAAPFQRLAQRLGIDQRVIWSTAGRDDIPGCLAASDALLLPAYDENTGTVILEAMLSGVPVLVTANCGYAPYVVTEEAGLVCPEPFVQMLLNEQLQTLLTSPQRERWRANGLAAGSSDRWFGLADAVIDVLEALAAGSTVPATVNHDP